MKRDQHSQVRFLCSSTVREYKLLRSAVQCSTPHMAKLFYPICSTVGNRFQAVLTYLLFYVCCLLWSGPGQDAWICKAGSQQTEDDKRKKHPTDDRYENGQMLHQEGTTVKGERKDCLFRHVLVKEPLIPSPCTKVPSYEEAFVCLKDTHSNAKKRPHVTTIRPSVRGRTPLCLARMNRPSQKNLFFPGNTSHFLRGRRDLFAALLCEDEGDADSVRGSICWYSQFFIVFAVPARFGGSKRHTRNSPSSPRSRESVSRLRHSTWIVPLGRFSFRINGPS